MAGLLDYFLTPKNVERGVNLLQGNQGIVNTLTGLPIGPSSSRAYIRNLSGSTEPITEDFFSTNQLDEIKRRTAESMANKSMIYEPDAFEKYRGDARRASLNVIPYNLESPLSLSNTFTNPKVDIDMTLGQAVYKQNPDGTIRVIDKHDFGGFEGAHRPGFYSSEGSESFYGQPRSREQIVPPSEEREKMIFAGETVPIEEMVGTPGTGMGITFKKFPGVEWKTYPPEYETQKYRVSEQPEDVLERAIDAYKKEGTLSKSKLARIVGGFYGQTDKPVDDEEETWDAGFKGQDIRSSAIPVNINLGKISHRDKLKANRNFARYVAEHRDIPSRIRKEAQRIAPRRITPRHSPHGGGPGTGGGADLSPGGGYGQSPTGSDIAGTPFSRGGILGAF